MFTVTRPIIRHSCESRGPAPLLFRALKALAPSFRWDDRIL